MAFTRLTNGNTASADDVHDNFVFVRAGNLLPLAEPTSGVLTPTTSVYDLGSSTYKFKDGFFAGSLSCNGMNSDNVTLKTRVVSIGAWNMAATQKAVTHGIADFKKIRTIKAIVRNDADTIYYPLDTYRDVTNPEVEGGVYDFTATTIMLQSKNGGFYGVADFVSMTTADNNRGFVTIEYEA